MSLYFMSLFYFSAGLMHFITPRFFLKMMPESIPFHKQIIYISGIAEMVIAVLLLFETYRSVAAWMVIVLLILVFPANIQMTINFWKKKKPFLWLTVIRLPLQFVLIWWAWLFTR